MSKTLTISLSITDTGESAYIKELDGVVATGYSTIDTIVIVTGKQIGRAHV